MDGRAKSDVGVWVRWWGKEGQRTMKTQQDWGGVGGDERQIRGRTREGRHPASEGDERRVSERPAAV